MGMHFTIPAPRALIEAQIESLIALLDVMDGDSDLEEDNEDRCAAHDDEGGALFAAYDGRWRMCPGDPDDAEDGGDAEEDDPSGGAIDDIPHDQEHLLIPKYGIDQTKGMTNVAVASLAWEEARRSYGNVRNVGHVVALKDAG